MVAVARALERVDSPRVAHVGSHLRPTSPTTLWNVTGAGDPRSPFIQLNGQELRVSGSTLPPLEGASVHLGETVVVAPLSILWVAVEAGPVCQHA